MPPVSANRKLRAALRGRILNRIAELGLSQAEAAAALGFDRQQMWRLASGKDVYSLERLVDAATALALEVRMQAVRPWGRG